jgi:uncharacterized protein (TIRG00374 family)
VDLFLTPAPGVRRQRARTIVLRSAVGLGAGALLVLVFLKLVNVGTILQRLEHLDITFALLCGVAFLAAWVVRALRWRRFLLPNVVSIPRVVGIYLIAIFINWLLPIRGGELAKSLLLRRSNNIPVSRSLPTVTMDKAMDLLPAVVLIALLPLAHLRLTQPLWILLLTILAVLGFGAVLLAFATWRRERTLSWLARTLARVLPRALRQHVEPFVIRFIDTLLRLARQPRLLMIGVAYTAVAVAFDSLFCFLAFRAVGEVVAFPVVLYGYTLYNLAYILPTPPGQVGSNEIIGLLVFSGLFGVSRSAVGAMFLFSHPWTAVLMVVCGIVCLSSMGLTLRGTLGLARAGRVAAEEAPT